MRPTNWCRQLPCFISQRGRRMGFQGHVEAPRPNALSQRRAGRPGPCVPRLPLRTTDVPVKTGPRTGSTTLAPPFAQCERGLQGPLTGEQCHPCRPRDATGEGVNERRLPCCNDGHPCTILHYASECDRTALPDHGKALSVFTAKPAQGYP